MTYFPLSAHQGEELQNGVLRTVSILILAPMPIQGEGSCHQGKGVEVLAATFTGHF
jgi:hypothetical protein